MQIRDLGELLIRIDGRDVPAGGKKPAAILSVLLVHANKRVSVDTMTAAIWGELAKPGAGSTLESHVWRLRKVLEPDRGPRQPPRVLVNDAGGYRLLVTEDEVDSLRFEQLVGEAGDLSAAGDASRALRRSDQALQLWRDRPFGPMADEIWATATAARLTELHVRVRELRAEMLLEVGNVKAALESVDPLIGEMPFREKLWALKMLALYRDGRAEEALTTFQRARATLVEEIGLEPGAELQAMHGRILSRDTRLLAPAAPAAPRAGEVHVPGRMSPLVGRAEELSQLLALTSSHPLVTVVGAAGCGKTRLSIDVARKASQQFPDGVWFVDLGSVEHADMIVDLANSVIGLPPAVVGTPIEALRTYTRERRMLLLFDNCEHVLSHVRPLLETLLGDDASCHVLATSREPTGLPGEVIWSLQPLAVRISREGRLVAGPALELFLARLVAAEPTTVLDEADMHVAAAICDALDGLPLAIELAAARIRSSSLPEILAQVTTDPGGLARIGSGAVDHRRTLRSTVDWSYRLLGEPEQILHRRLSVLPGPFSRTSATAIAGTPPLDPAVIPDLLASLVHQSMLTSTRSTRAGGPTLFAQLVSVRSHARHELHSGDAGDAVLESRHEWVRAVMRARPPTSAKDSGWFDVIDDNFATIRATLQHTLVDHPDALGWYMLARLSNFWYYRNRMTEASRWLELAEQTPPPGTDPTDVRMTRLSLAGIYGMRGRFDLARPLIDAALPGIENVPDEQVVLLAEHLGSMGIAASLHEEFELAGRFGNCVSTIADRSGRADLALLAQAMSCVTHVRSVPPSQTMQRADAIYGQAAAQGNLLVAWTVAGLNSSLAMLLDLPQETIVWGNRTITALLDIGVRQSAIPLENRANVAAVTGAWVRAVTMYAASRGQARRLGMRWPLAARTTDLLERSRRAMSPAEYEKAWSDGQSLTNAEIWADLNASRAARAAADAAPSPV